MFAARYVIVAVYLDGSGELELFRWTRDAASGIARAKREGAEHFCPSWVDDVRIEARPIAQEG